MNAVIYARYSSDNQREESIEGQLRECLEYAERSGITVIHNYIDRALSAKTDNRPEFQRMIKDSSKGEFEIVLVWKLDRFARNRFDSAHYKSILKKNRVKLLSVTEKIPDDSTGILLESLLEGFAEFYSVDLSEKIIRGQTENALKCKSNGGGHPVGYVVDSERRFQIDPLIAPLVVDAFNMYADGATVKEAMDYLNSKGVKAGSGKPLRFDAVKGMLRNRKYLGEYRYGDIVIPGGMPQIISQELFDRVARRIEKNRKAPARRKAKEEMYLLTTTLFCGKCEAFMVGERGTSRSGKVHHYYKCVNNKNHKGCDKKSVRKDYIEDYVVNRTMNMLKDDDLVESLVVGVYELHNAHVDSTVLLTKRIDETKLAIGNILDAIEKGVFTSSTKERLEELERQKSELEIELANEKIRNPKITMEQLRYWIKRFREIDPTDFKQREQLIDNFVNAVYLFDDRFTVNFNLVEGEETVLLSEIKCSGMDVAPPPGNVTLHPISFYTSV